MPAPKGHPPYDGCEKGGELGGRPTKYTAEFIEREADEFDKWMSRPDSIYLKRFCLLRGYAPQRLSEFASENKRFAEVYEKSKVWQETKLVEGGLLSEFNSGFCKFVMGNICNWTEKTQISGDAANPLQFLLDKSDGSSKELVNEQE